MLEDDEDVRGAAMKIARTFPVDVVVVPEPVDVLVPLDLQWPTLLTLRAGFRDRRTGDGERTDRGFAICDAGAHGGSGPLSLIGSRLQPLLGTRSGPR